MKISGTLTLIPTPLSETGELESQAFLLLNEAASVNQRENSIFVIEDLKPGRRRWLQFKLPRECVDNFVLYNEHTSNIVAKELLSKLQEGKNVFLMSDGGLPAFYDPGVELVRMCHQNHIRVTSTPFFNSVILALALSGFNHKKFWFEGFLPLDNIERATIIKKLLKEKYVCILMDTPYRLKRLLEELAESWEYTSHSKKIFVAMDLNCDTEELRLGTPKELLGAIKNLKREFVLLISE